MTATQARFAFFSEAETPEGAEGWERMYPYYLVPQPERKADDDQRFWFANTMHFSRGCYPFDSMTAEGVYLGAGLFSARIFVLPVALGLDLRVVNGFVYQSPTPITDPDVIAERAVLFQERSSYYYEHWDELYARWKEKMAAATASLRSIAFPVLGEVDPAEVVTEARGRSTCWDVIENYHRLVNDYFVILQYHFEFLNLGYGAYITLFQFCKQAFPDIADQTIARMVAGVDVLAFRPDEELRRLARLARDLGLTSQLDRDDPAEQVLADLGATEDGRTWLRAFDEARRPWFDYFAEYGFSHDQETWNTDLSLPLSGIRRYALALAGGDDIDRPVERLRKERDEIVDGYRALLGPEEAAQFDALVALAHRVFPYIEEHNIFVEHWSFAVFWEKAHELARFLRDMDFMAEADDMFYLNRFEVDEVLNDVIASWAIGVPARGVAFWGEEIARRRGIVAALRAQIPPPAFGTPPDQVTDPFAVMNFGVTTDRVSEWLGQSDGDAALTGVAAAPGVIEGRARVLRSEKDLPLLEPGEILVAPITAPSWAPAFSIAAGVVTDTGGMMSHAAIVCREYGVPAVVGTGYATARLSSGQRLRVDGNAGTVDVLDEVGP